MNGYGDGITDNELKKCLGCSALLPASDPDVCERCDEHDDDVADGYGDEDPDEVTSDEDLQTILYELVADQYPNGLGVSTFDEAGVLTYNKGLVVRTADGAEFQVTIVRSR